MKQKLSALIRRDGNHLQLRRVQGDATYLLIIRHSIGELQKLEGGRLTGHDYITMRDAVILYQQHEWEVVDGTTDTVREAL